MPLKAWTTQNCMFIPPLVLLLIRRLRLPYLRFAGNEHPKWLSPLFASTTYAGCLLFRRNDRQQQIGRFAAAEMQRGGAAENGGRAVARIVVQERAAAGELVLEVRQLAAAGAAIFVILAAHRQADAIAGGNCDRSRPDFDVEFHGLALAEWLLLVVAVIGPVGQRQFLV